MVNLHRWHGRGQLKVFLMITAVVVVICGLQSGWTQQSFESGSTGSDGPLNLTTPGTITFDPKTFNPPLDPDGDNVYHFTTITIASGVTVKLSGKIFNGSISWLASGAVDISGTLDLNGEMGYTTTANLSDRVPIAPGPGGFAGGVGGSSSAFPAQPGNGPGGGAAGAAGSYNYGYSGTFAGSQYLVPLLGGSGGGGGFNSGSAYSSGAGGGGGGGAILIASSTSISIAGSITANGGVGGYWAPINGGLGGGGSGGAIRLVSNSIIGAGSISANGGSGGNGGSGHGRIRLETFLNNFTGGLGSAAVSRSLPFKLGISATARSSVRVTKIAGIAISSNPFTFPDVTFDSSVPVTVEIEARFIPTGTVPKLYIFSETSGDQTVDAAPLQGNLNLSTSTVSITFPPGGSRGFVKTIWTQ